MSDLDAPPDGGFVLLDALLATGLVAFAGTMVIVIANSVLAQQERELERSVALVGMQSLAKQYLLLGEAPNTSLEREDELFVYRFERSTEPVAGSTALIQMVLLAEAKSGGGKANDLRLDFLAPATAR